MSSDLPTTPSVIRARGNGPELMFGPDAADQWVTLDGEWWVGCDLTDVRVLWSDDGAGPTGR